MEPLTLSNRFSVLESSDNENESLSEQESPIKSPQKRTSRRYHSRSCTHDFVIKQPPLLTIPRELRWMIFDELVDSITTIEISPSTIDSFHALRLTTKGLRAEVKAWAKKRPDAVNSFPYGYYIPSQTTFVLKIDHRWKKVVKNKTVSGSHLTYKDQSTNIPIEQRETKAIKYLSREQAWRSFCRTRSFQGGVANMHLKFEISLSPDMSPESMSYLSRQELFEALSAAQYYVRSNWASMHLYLHGTLDQITRLQDDDLAAQIGDLLQVTQKTSFDDETWNAFRENAWENERYEELSYPMEILYWEDDKYKIFKRTRDNEDIYEYGGKVMEFVVKSARDMRRGPVACAMDPNREAEEVVERVFTGNRSRGTVETWAEERRRARRSVLSEREPELSFFTIGNRVSVSVTENGEEEEEEEEEEYEVRAGWLQGPE